MKKILTTLFFASALLLSSTMIHAEESVETPKAVTTGNPDVTPEKLHLMVRHMTGDELFIEADGWLVLLKEAAKKVYDTKIAIQDKNAQIDALGAKDNNQTAAEEREGDAKDTCRTSACSERPCTGYCHYRIG